MKKDARLFPWYALLFGVYPALALLARNIGEVEYGVAYRAILVSIFVSVFSALILYLVFRDWNKAGISLRQARSPVPPNRTRSKDIGKGSYMKGSNECKFVSSIIQAGKAHCCFRSRPTQETP